MIRSKTMIIFFTVVGIVTSTSFFMKFLEIIDN
nr:MAG TPA: hypothetical protein [Caudoviricetes sp.]